MFFYFLPSYNINILPLELGPALFCFFQKKFELRDCLFLLLNENIIVFAI